MQYTIKRVGTAAGAYMLACQDAREQSMDGCSTFVCAVLGKNALGIPEITGFQVSDWFDDSVVATFCKGNER